MQRSSCRVDAQRRLQSERLLLGRLYLLPIKAQSGPYRTTQPTHTLDINLETGARKGPAKCPFSFAKDRASPLISVCIGVVPRPRGSGRSNRLIDYVAGAHTYCFRWIPAGLPGRPSGRSRPLEIDTLPPGLQGLVVSRGRVGTRGDGGALGKVPRPLGERFRPAASNLRYHTLYL